MLIKFRKWNKEFDLKVKFESYANGGTAITLWEDNEPFMTASVWIEGLKENEIAIKNYSENEGILEALIKANIITRPHRNIPSGWVMIPICKLKEWK